MGSARMVPRNQEGFTDDRRRMGAPRPYSTPTSEEQTATVAARPADTECGGGRRLRSVGGHRTMAVVVGWAAMEVVVATGATAAAAARYCGGGGRDGGGVKAEGGVA